MYQQCLPTFLKLYFLPTGTFAGTAAGDFLPLQLIYGGKTDKCHPVFKFPTNFNVTHSENHWANSSTMAEYIETIVSPYVEETKDALDLPLAQRSLVIFDCFRGQITSDFLEILDKHCLVYATVPPNCTDRLQPMDLSVNKSAKDFLKAEFQQWYANEVLTKLNGTGGDVDEDNAACVDLSLTKLKTFGSQVACENVRQPV